MLDPLSFTRRRFLSGMSHGCGAAALASLLPQSGNGAVLGGPHLAPRAKRVIYLFMAGGPAQQDLFDYKPKLREDNGQALPDHVRRGQRLTGMSGNQSSLPLASRACA